MKATEFNNVVLSEEVLVKAPPVVRERFIHANHLARYLFAANIDAKVGREIGECARFCARCTKRVVHDHEAVGGTNLANGERLTIGEQDSLRVSEDSRGRSTQQHHHEPCVHDQREAP